MLSDLIVEGRSLVLYCTKYRCGGFKVVDVPAVIEAQGDISLQEFAERSRCLKCGTYEPQTVCSPIDTGPARNTGASHVGNR